MSARTAGVVVFVALPALCVVAGISAAYIHGWLSDRFKPLPGDWGQDWPFDDDGEPFEVQS